MRRLGRLAVAVAVAVVVAGLAPACSATDGTTLTVSAASSLTDAFAELETSYEVAHPGVDVVVNAGSSSTLARQIGQGAPADVFAAADQAAMEVVVADPGTDGAPVVFATNTLVIVTAPGNPAGITGPADLATVDGVVARCAAAAPCGRYTDALLAEARTTLSANRVTEGQDVRATLTAVTEGGAVAGIVYRSDAVAAGERVTVVAVPEAEAVEVRYPLAVVSGTELPADARSFVELVTGPEGRAVLERYGFGTP